MAEKTSKETITISVDGREVSAVKGTTVLEVADGLGIDIPTLCHQKTLEPQGACRLCLVEQVKDGWSDFVTACNYPVGEGMAFKTTSPRLISYRKTIFESLLARCSTVPQIQALAKEHGVGESRFRTKKRTCILCGMCIRVCQSFATSAIASMDRGTQKKIGTFAGEAPNDCVGCGGCHIICPVNHIKAEQKAGFYNIWGRAFELPICTVDETKCIGCGICEESCPFKIPRIIQKRGDLAHSHIDLEACKGCGVCAAMCPSQAITSKDISDGQIRESFNTKLPNDLKNKLLVFVCHRADIQNVALPEKTKVIELPCVGGVSLVQIIGGMSLGAKGVLVLGRDQDTCRLNGAEEVAEKTVNTAADALRFLGFDKNCVQFSVPPKENRGVEQTIAEYALTLAPSPLAQTLPDTFGLSTLDDAIRIAKWLFSRTELVSREEQWLIENGFEIMTTPKAALLAEDLPVLELLLSDKAPALNGAQLLREGLSVLKSHGIQAQITFTPPDSPALPVYTISKTDIPKSVYIPTLSSTAKNSSEVDEAFADTAASAQLSLNKKERQQLMDSLTHAAYDNRDFLAVDTASRLIQLLIIQRKGSWRTSHVKPILKTGALARQIKTIEVNKEVNNGK